MDRESLSYRFQKGRSLLAAVEDYVAVDLETTGLSPYTCSIIEIAAARYEGGVLHSHFESLVNPGCSISPFITNLTGITGEMVADASPIDEVLPEFIRFVGGSVIVGHNVGFDIGFITQACARCLECAFPNDYIDTMRISRRLFKHFPNHKLPTLVREMGIGSGTEHRALADVICTAGCYEYMKKELRSRSAEGILVL